MRFFILAASIITAAADFGRAIRRDFDWVLFTVFMLAFAALIVALASSGGFVTPQELVWGQ